MELLEELDPGERADARATLTTVVFGTDAGHIPISEWLEAARSGPGVLVLDGVLAAGVHVGVHFFDEILDRGQLTARRKPM